MMAFSMAARALAGSAAAWSAQQAEGAPEHDIDEANYGDIVYVHFAFGCASILGAMAVYCVYLGLPKGKLDPARYALKRGRNDILRLGPLLPHLFLYSHTLAPQPDYPHDHHMGPAV